MSVRLADGARRRSSGPSDSLAPPPSPYPQQTDPSPVDSNGTASTEIEDQPQEDGGAKDMDASTNGEVRSPDIEITSPEDEDTVCAFVRHSNSDADTCRTISRSSIRRHYMTLGLILKMRHPLQYMHPKATSHSRLTRVLGNHLQRSLRIP